MAFKLALRLPFLGREAQAKPARATPQRAFLSRPLWLIGRLPIARQMQLLTSLLIALLLVDAAIVAVDTRQATFNTLYIATVGKIRMLSQRLAKAAQQASQGNAAAFRQLRESRDEFAAALRLLVQGGAAGQVSVPASPEDVRQALGVLEGEWKKNERNAGLVIG